MASFKLGYADGADGCELDFYSTKDHRLIVIHNATTKRVAGVDKEVSDQTFNELRALEFGNGIKPIMNSPKGLLGYSMPS